MSQFSLALSLGHIFNEMCEVTKVAWPSDIAKEKFDTNLKVHCAIYVTFSAKTVPFGTFGILRNTILKH